MFKYTETMAFTYNIQSVVCCRKFSMKQNVDVSCLRIKMNLFTYDLYNTCSDCRQGSKNPFFLKKSPSKWFFGSYWVFGFYWVFWTSRKK